MSNNTTGVRERRRVTQSDMLREQKHDLRAGDVRVTSVTGLVLH